MNYSDDEKAKKNKNIFTKILLKMLKKKHNNIEGTTIKMFNR